MMMSSQLRFLSSTLSKNRCPISSRTASFLHKPPFNYPSCLKLTCNARRYNSTENQSFLQKFLAPKVMPPRNTPAWYREMVLLCTVFAITGSSTMFLVRPAMSNVLGLRGSFKDGPWSYRICSIVIMTPLYATLLVVVGTVFGRHAYFRHFAVKMFSRFGIPPSLMDKNFERNAKNFKKWWITWLGSRGFCSQWLFPGINMYEKLW